MTVEEARIIVQRAYGDDRDEAEELCFGDCCLSSDEKKALLTLIYGEAS